MANKFPILYIIVRRDMNSMTPGRVAAMASHATSLMEYIHKGIVDKTEFPSPVYNDWVTETTQGYGTTIVLETHNWEKFKEGVFEEIDALCSISPEGSLCGIVEDPTYAVKDGSVTHFLPVQTCAFVLCYKGGKIQKVFEDIPLYSGK